MNNENEQPWYYIDIGFQVDRIDLNFFAMSFLSFIHHKNYKYNFALSFPNFQEAQNLERPQYAKFGNVLRIFHPEFEKLDSFIKEKFFKDLKEKKMVINTFPAQTPLSNTYEVYIRDQVATHIREVIKNIKSNKFTEQKDANFWKRKLDNLKLKEINEMKKKIYIICHSFSNKQNFSIIIRRDIYNIKENNSFSPTSYGLSNIKNKNYLPIFKTPLDL